MGLLRDIATASELPGVDAVLLLKPDAPSVLKVGGLTETALQVIKETP